MHKCILAFKCLYNLVPKYLTQYFTRNADLHDHVVLHSAHSRRYRVNYLVFI